MALPSSTSAALEIELADLIELRHQARDIALFPSGSKRSHLVGIHSSRLRGRGIDFDQVRLYQPGDDIRTIDWRVTARTQEPYTKLFHEEKEKPVFLLVEQSARLLFGSVQSLKSVTLAKAAALVGWAALARNDRVGGLVFTDSERYAVHPRRNKQSLLQLLNLLQKNNHALLQQQPGNGADTLSMALRRARESLKPGSLLFVFCDERSLTELAEQQLLYIARHIDLILLPIADPLDHDLPDGGLLRFAQGARGLQINTHSAALRSRYAKQAQQRQQHWRQTADKARALLYPLDNVREAADQLSGPLRACLEV